MRLFWTDIEIGDLRDAYFRHYRLTASVRRRNNHEPKGYFHKISKNNVARVYFGLCAYVTAADGYESRSLYAGQADLSNCLGMESAKKLSICIGNHDVESHWQLNYPARIPFLLISPAKDNLKCQREVNGWDIPSSSLCNHILRIPSYVTST